MANQDSGVFVGKTPAHTRRARTSHRSAKSPLRRAYEAVAIVGSLVVLGAVSAWEFWKEWRR